jgi:short-subunit dehydrogenase
MSTVLITGASSGIWFEMARIFARDGYDLVLVARRKEELEKISKEFPERKVMILEKDLSLEFSPLEVYEAVKKDSIHDRYSRQ